MQDSNISQLHKTIGKISVLSQLFSGSGNYA